MYYLPLPSYPCGHRRALPPLRGSCHPSQLVSAPCVTLALRFCLYARAGRGLVTGLHRGFVVLVRGGCDRLRGKVVYWKSGLLKKWSIEKIEKSICRRP